MATENLKKLGKEQLVKLFSAGGYCRLSPRAQAIVAELQARGLIFDIRYGDFVDCEQWNIRHKLELPMDCERQRRLMEL